MDKAAFEEAIFCTVGKSYDRNKVGLLSEKCLHAVLKHYFEPDHSFHEQKIEGFYADICRMDSIIEIQTHNLCALKKKLTAFLPKYKVEVVYPIPATKWLVWMDPLTGDCDKGRRVPKKGSFYDSGRELLSLAAFIGHPNLTIRLLLIDMEEYRLKNGRSADGKRYGATRCERYPLSLVDELVIDSDEALSTLIPSTMPTPFTAAEFRHETHTGPRVSTALLALLRQKGLVEQVSKKGRAFLYRPLGQ